MIEKVGPEKQAGHDGDSDRPDADGAEKSAGRLVKGPTVFGQPDGEVVVGGREPVIMGEDDVTVTDGSAAISAMLAATIDGHPAAMGEDESGGREDIRNERVQRLFELAMSEDWSDLIAFYDRRLPTHAMAEGKLLGDFLPTLNDKVGLDVDEALESVDPWYFYAASDRLSSDMTDPGVTLGTRKSRIGAKLTRDDPVCMANYREYAGVGLVDLAARCPRFLPGDEDPAFLRVPTRDWVSEALRYQLLFSKQAHRVIAASDGHRKLYFFASVAGLLAHKAQYKAAIPPADTKLPAPSLGVGDKILRDQHAAREFLNARLALLFPDKEKVESLFSGDAGARSIAFMVQEDFVTADLIAFAREAGIYEEYEKIFSDMFRFRQLQFMSNFHFGAVSRPRDDRWTARGRRYCVTDVFRKWRDPSGQRSLPDVVSIGCGLGYMESRLLDMCGSLVGVEKRDDSTGKKPRALSSGRRHGGASGKLFIVGAQGVDFNDRQESAAFRRRIISSCGDGDVAILADVLHETDDPMQYAVNVCDEVLRPGGYLYVSDPVHCKAVDGQTSVTLNPFDKTRHPSSMMSLEDYYKLMLYLETRGMSVISIDIVPGAYAGYGDALWRLSLVMKKKISKDAPFPYQFPHDFEDAGEELHGAEDVFGVFPFNLISDSVQRADLGFEFGQLVFADGLPRDQVRRVALNRLCSGCDVEKLLSDAEPYKRLEDLLKAVGQTGDDELRRRNRQAAEVIVIAEVLRGRMRIDIAPKLIRAPGWEQYL